MTLVLVPMGCAMANTVIQTLLLPRRGFGGEREGASKGVGCTAVKELPFQTLAKHLCPLLQLLLLCSCPSPRGPRLALVQRRMGRRAVCHSRLPTHFHQPSNTAASSLQPRQAHQ